MGKFNWHDRGLKRVVQAVREYIRKIYEDQDGIGTDKKNIGSIDFLDEEHDKIDMPAFNDESYDELDGIPYIRVLYQFKNNYDSNPMAQDDAVGKRHEYFRLLMSEIDELLDRHFRYNDTEVRGKLIPNSDKFVIAFFSGAADTYASRGPKAKSVVEQKIQAVLNDDDWGYMSSREFGMTESTETDLPILEEYINEGSSLEVVDGKDDIGEHFKKYMKKKKAEEPKKKKTCCGC